MGVAAGTPAAKSSPSLDPEETNPPPPPPEILSDYTAPREEFRVTPINAAENTWRHSCWCGNRKRVWCCLQSIAPNSNRLDRFANCGSGCTVEYSPSTKQLRTVANYCHDRLCVPCGNARGRRIERSLRAFCKTRTIRFVTLTLRHNRLPLADQITRLYQCFSTLRRRQWWLSNVRGGCAILEVKYKPAADQWHPHLHLLVEGDYIPQKELSANWYAVTGDSFIVDVRAVGRDKQEIGYVTKYVSKPVETAVYEAPEKLAEFATAIRGRRLCLTFGLWRGLDLDADGPDPGDWRRLGSFSDLVADAACGDRWALSILADLRHRHENKDRTPLPSDPDG